MCTDVSLLYPLGRVLICASDDRTCAQLKEYINKGAESLLTRLYTRTIGKNEASFDHAFEERGKAVGRKDQGKGPTGKKPRAKQAKSCKTNLKPALTLTQMVGKEDGVEGERMGSSADEGEEETMEEEKLLLSVSSEAYYGIMKEPLTVIHPLRGCTDPYSLTRVLHEVEPSYVVLYDAELSFVRQLEIYKASRPGKQLRYSNRSSDAF